MWTDLLRQHLCNAKSQQGAFHRANDHTERSQQPDDPVSRRIGEGGSRKSQAQGGAGDVEDGRERHEFLCDRSVEPRCDGVDRTQHAVFPAAEEETETNPPPLPAALLAGVAVEEPERSQGSVRALPRRARLQAQVHLQEPGAAKHPQVGSARGDVTVSREAALTLLFVFSFSDFLGTAHPVAQ